MKQQSEKSKRSQIAFAFECAKQYLWTEGGLTPKGKSPFICHALYEAESRGEIQTEVYSAAKKIVMQRLDGHYSLGDWLTDRGVSSYSVTARKMGAHRLAWLNMLIKEFQGPSTGIGLEDLV